MLKELFPKSYACALGERSHIPDAVKMAGSGFFTAGAWLQVDDDSYVHVDALLNLLSKLPAQHLFLGNIDEGPGGPHRDPASPWHVTEEEWPSRHYPMWAHGAGYVLSKVSLCHASHPGCTLMASPCRMRPWESCVTCCWSEDQARNLRFAGCPQQDHGS